MADAKVQQLPGTEFEYGESSAGSAFKVIAAGLGGMAKQRQLEQAQFQSIAPTLIANKMLAPWEDDSKGSPTQFGGMPWETKESGTDWDTMMKHAQWTKLNNELLTGGIDQGSMFKTSASLMQAAIKSDPMFFSRMNKAKIADKEAIKNGKEPTNVQDLLDTYSNVALEQTEALKTGAGALMSGGQPTAGNVAQSSKDVTATVQMVSADGATYNVPRASVATAEQGITIGGKQVKLRRI